MPPAREICDSEEEVSPVKSRNGVANYSNREGASDDLDEKHFKLSSLPEKSTDSTEEQLRQAHLDLMAPTQQEFVEAVTVFSSLTSPIRERNTISRKRIASEHGSPQVSHPKAKLKRVKTSPQEYTSAKRTTRSDLALPADSITSLLDANGDFPGDTVPDTYVMPGQTPTSTRNRKRSSQRSQVDETLSSFTPWSLSAINSSHSNPSKSNEDGVAADRIANTDTKSSQSRMSSSNVKSSRASKSDDITSDDVLVGLPKEQYNPRPSRSRSNQVEYTPVDYSIIPEKAAAKARRIKTTNDTLVKSDEEVQTDAKIFPSNPILQAPDFEALSPQLQPVDANTEEHVPDLPMLEDANVEKSVSVAQAEKSAKNAKKALAKKRGRPRKNPLPEPVDEANEQDELALEHSQHRPVDVSVRISPPRLEGAAGKAVDMSRIIAALGSDKKQSPALDSSAHELEESKHSPEFGIEQDRRVPAPNPTPNVAAVSEPDTKSRKSTASKANKPSSIEKSATSIETEAPLAPEPEEKQSEQATPSMTTKKETAKATPAKNSPLSWQQSRYRVGLSRSQKTQPLLKTFKR